jgi:uncharacterized protein YjdB
MSSSQKHSYLVLLVAVVSCGESGSAGPPEPEPPPSVAAVTVSPADTTLRVGQSAGLRVTVSAANGTPLPDRPVVWSSSNESVVRVQANGQVSAVSPGRATVTALAESRSGSAEVTVTQVPVSALLLTPDSVEIRTRQTRILNVVLRDSAGNVLEGRPISWRSNDSTVAKVNSTGVVEGVRIGTVAVIASSDGVETAARIVVSSPPIDRVVLSPVAISLPRYDSVHMAAAVFDSAGFPVATSVVWSVADTTVARVTSTTGRDSAVVMALRVGGTVVRAAASGVLAQADLTVSPPPVAGVRILPDSLELLLGGTAILTATAFDRFGEIIPSSAVTWLSLDPAIATVSDGSAEVTAKSLGVARVIASSGSRADTIRVIVRPLTGLRIDIATPDNTSDFVLGVHGGGIGSGQNNYGPQLARVTVPAGNQSTVLLSLPPGGPYEVRVIAIDMRGRTNAASLLAGPTGMFTTSHIEEGELRRVNLQLSHPTFTLTVPDTVSPGQIFDVRWRMHDRGRSFQDAGALFQSRPVAFLRVGTQPFADVGGGGSATSVVAEYQIVGPDLVEFSARVTAPLTANAIYLQTWTFTFASSYNEDTERIRAFYFLPSSRRDEALVRVIVR